MTKYILAFIGAVVIAGAIYGAYLYPKATQPFGTSGQGTTLNSAKFYGVAGVNLATPGANGTSTSILNNTGNDLYPTAIRAGCESVGTSKTAYTGAGLSSLQISVGTSSTAAPAAVPTTLVNGAVITIATSSPQFELNTIVTSSSLGGAVWPSNTYMTFWSNATNTAMCTFGVDAITS